MAINDPLERKLLVSMIDRKTVEPPSAQSPDRREKTGLSCSPRGIMPPKVIASESLFAGAKLVVIDHEGEPYRLMITKNGKLILQK